MLRAQVVHRDPSVTLMRVDHPPERDHRDPAEECASDHAVSFIEQGGFDLHRGRRTWRMGETSLFVTHPGFSYRCSHPEAHPTDRCLSVRFAPALVDDVQGTTGRAWVRSSPEARLTNRLAYLLRRLMETAAGDGAAMGVVPLAGELLAAVDERAPATAPLFPAHRLAWYAGRVDVAREMLTRRFAEPLTLGSVAREAGMSPFHFSRVFRNLAGVTPHRFLVRVRLSNAARRLEEGSSVTDACHACGFNNLSHFTRTFRRAYGVPPSSYRS
jgi:AraC family transcriptional regulator